MNELLNIFEKKKSEYLDYLKKFIEIDTQTIGHGIKGGNEKNGQIFLENLFNELDVFKIKKETNKKRFKHLFICNVDW